MPSSGRRSFSALKFRLRWRRLGARAPRPGGSEASPAHASDSRCRLGSVCGRARAGRGVAER